MKIIIGSILVGTALAQFDNDADSPVIQARKRGGKKRGGSRAVAAAEEVEEVVLAPAPAVDVAPAPPSQEDAIEAYVNHIMASGNGDPMDELYAIAFRQRAKAQGLPKDLYNGISNALMDSNRGLNCKGPECEVPVTLSGIWQYGCWCNFGRNLMTGQGPPVNQHDVVCKYMNDCLKCAKRDATEDGYICEPRTAVYKAELAWATNIQAIETNCARENPGDLCGAHVCTCELQLIDDLLDLVWESYVYDPQYLHSTGWDFEANCPAAADIGDIDCCGKYPRRSPFRLGQKECCEGIEKVYNPFKEQCCESGIEDLGEVC